MTLCLKQSLHGLLWLQGGCCLLAWAPFQKMRMAQARLRLWSPTPEVRLAPSPKWNRVNMIMYGLLPPTATVVITYAHYGFKEVVVCLLGRLAENEDGTQAL